MDIDGIILREKDMSETEYEVLAEDVLAICERYHKKCILHSFPDAARRLGCQNIHLPLRLLLENSGCMDGFVHIGSSVHSVQDALDAQAAGATYLTAGHIFDTDCKKGLPGRGMGFLAEVCRAVNIPVYAIGGITEKNLPEVMAAGAAGGCMMSLAMRM